jgi:mutator protein MutT
MPRRSRALDDALRSRLARNIERFERRVIPLEDRRAAAVALTLLPDEGARPSVILTRRAQGLRRHGGQWAIPGGRLDPGETPEQSALRELGEEVGVKAHPNDVLGRLDDYATRSGFVITPIVVWAAAATGLEPDPNEVAEAYRVPVAELDHPDSPVLSRIPESERPVISIPFRGDFLHAPTAAMLYQLLEVAFHGRATRVHHYEQPVFAWT